MTATNSRAEKPAVPTPDAAEVWAEHQNAIMGKLSIPERAALARYLQSTVPREWLETSRAERLRLEEQHRQASWFQDSPGVDDMPNPDPRKQAMRDEQDAQLAAMDRVRASTAVSLLSDICDAAFGDPQRAEVHGYAGVLEQVRYLVAAKDFDRNGDWEPTLCGNGYRHKLSGGTVFPCDGRWDIDCGKGVCISAGGHYRTLSEAAAEVERLARTPTPPREDVPAAVCPTCTLPDGWRWDSTHSAAHHTHLRSSVDTLQGWVNDTGGWYALCAPSAQQAEPRTLAAAQAALLAELRSRGVLPAVPQPDGGASGEAGDVHGLGSGWAQRLSPAWEHESGARINEWRSLDDSMGWMWWRADEEMRPADRAPVATAREAAALALGTLPTPAPAVVAGEVELDWNAVRKCGGPMSGMCETQDVVRMLREYHTQLTARLAALEARR
jgi:hypothetical protein